MIVLSLLVCLTLFALFCYKHIKNKRYFEETAISAIELTDDELNAFEEYFDMTIPKNMYIQNCAYGDDDSTFWYALKATISPEELRTFLKYLDDENNFEKIKIYNREFKGIPIDDGFADAFEWWNIDVSNIQSSYNLYYNDESITGASAIVVCEADNVNYIYFWFTDPAMVHK